MNPVTHYFVVTPTGDRFGPVDICTLNQWGNEGRILPHTILIEANTGRQLMAAQLAGLNLPDENAYRSPYQQSPKDYPRIVDTQADKIANWAIAMGYCSLLLCPGLCIIGLILAFVAKSQGSMKAQKAVRVNVIALIIMIILIILLQWAMNSISSWV